jgi:hypothetical protein
MMLSWIDNTGLHGAGRCVTGSAETGYDLRSFLQLAVLLVFSDRLAWGNFESRQVEEESLRYQREFSKAGVQGAIADRNFVGQGGYQSACDRAAEAAVASFRFEFRPGARAAAGVALLDLPRGAEHHSKALIRLIRSEDPEEIAHVRRDALNSKAPGAVKYMLAANPELRKMARERLARDQSWTPGDSFDFEGYLRALLNRELATQHRGLYVPAPSRAALIHVADRQTIELLQAHVSVVAKELRQQQRPLAEVENPVPRVADALISLARGSVTGLLEQAMRFRERAKPLRDYLSYIDTEPNTDAKQQKDLPILANDLRRDLGLTSGNGAIRITGSVGTASPAATAGIDPREIFDWIRRQWTKGRRIVLTEMARESAWKGSDRAARHKLAEAATGRTLDSDHPILTGLT